MTSPITKAPETRGPERIPVVFDPFTHCRVLMHSGDCPSEVVSAVAYDSLARELETAKAMLEECAEYFEDRSDVIDGSYGEPAPNKEMAIASAIRSVLARAALKPSNEVGNDLAG